MLPVTLILSNAASPLIFVHEMAAVVLVGAAEAPQLRRLSRVGSTTRWSSGWGTSLGLRAVPLLWGA